MPGIGFSLPMLHAVTKQADTTCWQFYVQIEIQKDFHEQYWHSDFVFYRDLGIAWDCRVLDAVVRLVIFEALGYSRRGPCSRMDDLHNINTPRSREPNFLKIIICFHAMILLFSNLARSRHPPGVNQSFQSPVMTMNTKYRLVRMRLIFFLLAASNEFDRARASHLEDCTSRIRQGLEVLKEKLVIRIREAACG